MVAPGRQLLHGTWLMPLCLFLLSFQYPVSAAEFDTLIVLSEGDAPGQVGVSRGALRVYDVLPSFQVDAQGNVVIGDDVNNRLSIFNPDGSFRGQITGFAPNYSANDFLLLAGEEIVTRLIRTGYDTLSVFDYQGTEKASLNVPPGELVDALPAGGFVFGVSGTGRYLIYDNGLALLGETDTFPGALGEITELPTDEGILVLVEYPDLCFSFIDAGMGMENFYRHGDRLVVVSGDSAWTLNPDGSASGVILPPSEFGEDPADSVPPDEDLADTEPELVVEYLAPVIGRNGAVYALRRTPGALEIIKYNIAELPPDDQGILPVVNTPPEITFVGNTSVYPNETLQVRIVANDADGDTVRLEVSGVPEGARYDPRDRKLEWVPATGQVGQYMIQVRASDTTCGVSTLPLLVEVLQPE